MRDLTRRRPGALRTYICLLTFALLSGFLSPAYATVDESTLREELTTHYRDCLNTKEIDQLIKLKKELEDLKSMKALDPHMEIERIIEDETASDDLCDKLPSFLKGIKYGRDLAKLMDKHVRVPVYNKEVARAFKKYIKRQVELGDCKYFDDLTPEDISPTVAHSLGKTWPQLQEVFRRAAEDYCDDLHEIETKIKDIEDKCRQVPDLIGMNYDMATDKAQTAGFSYPVIQQDDIKSRPFSERKVMIVRKQEPPPGTLMASWHSIKVWLGRGLKELKVTPSEWKGADVGHTNRFSVTAQFEGGKPRLVTKECYWISAHPKVADAVDRNGGVKATGPGSTKITVSYSYNDGLALQTDSVQVPIAVRKPSPTLQKLKISPTQWKGARPGTTKSFRANGYYSDAPSRDIDVTDQCEWRTPGTVAKVIEKGPGAGVVTVSQNARHGDRSQVIATLDGKEAIAVITVENVTLADFLLKLQGTPDVHPTDTRNIVAEAKYSTNPNKWVDVTSQAIWKSHGRPDITVTKGHVTFNGLTLPATKHAVSATYSFGGSTKADAISFNLTKKKIVIQKRYTKLTLSDTSLGMKPWKVHQLQAIAWYLKIPHSLHENVTKDPNTRWTSSDTSIASVADGLIQTKDSQGICRITATFTTPGGQQLSASCQVSVTSDMIVDFDVSPVATPHCINQPMSFIENVQVNNRSEYDFIWYVGSIEYQGPAISHTFRTAGKYTIRLVAHNRITGDEDALAKTIDIETCAAEEPKPPKEPPVISPPEQKPTADARWRNKFEARVTNRGLEVCGKHWAGNKWSDCNVFRRLKPVSKHIIATGEQSDGINTGWLVYSLGASKLKYEVYGYKHAEHRAYVKFNGTIDTDGRMIDPMSIRFKNVESRAVMVEWKTRNGSLCKTRIWSFQKSAGNYLTGGGIEPTECIESGADISGRGNIFEDAPTALQAAADAVSFSPSTVGENSSNNTAENMGLECSYVASGSFPQTASGTMTVNLFRSPADALTAKDAWYRMHDTTYGDANPTWIELTWHEVSFHGLLAYAFTVDFKGERKAAKADVAAGNKATAERLARGEIGAYSHGFGFVLDNAWCAVETVTPNAGLDEVKLGAEHLYRNLKSIKNRPFGCAAPEDSAAGPGCSDQTIWGLFPTAAEADLPSAETTQKKGKSFQIGEGNYATYSRKYKEEVPSSKQGLNHKGLDIVLDVHQTPDDALRYVKRFIDNRGKYAIPKNGRELSFGDRGMEFNGDQGPVLTLIAVENAVISASAVDHTTSAFKYHQAIDEALLRDMVSKIRNLPCDLTPNGGEDSQGPQVAVAKYQSTEWPVRLNKGVLEVRGAAGINGSWGTQWKKVDRDVTGFKATGTGKGPVLIYSKRNGKKTQWMVCMRDGSSGDGKTLKTFDQPTSFLSAGQQFGVKIKSGDSCYDCSWSEVKPYDCETGLYIPKQ